MKTPEIRLSYYRILSIFFFTFLCSTASLAQSIDVSDDFPCIDDVVRYEVIQPPSGPISWSLDPLLGNVIEISPGIITVEYTIPGTTTLTFMIGNTTLTEVITVEPKVDARITSTQGLDCGETPGTTGLIHCLGDVSDVFTASPTGDVSWTSTGMISLSSQVGQSVTGTYTGLGAFSMTATVTTQSGCTNEYTYLGVVQEVPQISITNNIYNPDNTINVCLDETLTFGLDQDPEDNIIEWIVNGVLIPGNILDYTFSTQGQYTIELRVRTPCNCEDVTDVAIVNVDSSPKYNIICRETACSGDELTYRLDLFNGAGAICQDVTWSVVNGTPSSTTGTEIMVQWDAVSMTTVGQVIITPSSSCQGCLEPTILEVPILGSMVDLEVDLECTESAATFSTLLINGASYTWDFDVLSSTNASVTNTASANFSAIANPYPVGHASVEIEYPVGGCMATGSKTIYRKPRYSINNTTLCAGARFRITPGGASAENFEALYELIASDGSTSLSGVVNFNQVNSIRVTDVGEFLLRISNYRYIDNGSVIPLPL